MFIKQQRDYRWVGIFERRSHSLDPTTKTMTERAPFLDLLTSEDGRAEPFLTLEMLAECPRTIMDRHRMWTTIVSSSGVLGAIDVISEAPLGRSDLLYLDMCSRALRSIYRI
jgi:hypothetical protein